MLALKLGNGRFAWRLVGCGCLALLFGVSAGSKLLHLSELWMTLEGIKLLPSTLVRSASQILISVEVAIAICLVVRSTRKIALFGSLALGTLFAAYSAWRVVAGISAPCGCFSGIFTLPAHLMLLLDLALIGLSGALIANEVVLGSIGHTGSSSAATGQVASE